MIVGGGIAGLSAARELTRNGVEVTLLEAKNRLGGRIHTLSHGSYPIELGAELIHGRSPPLLQAIKSAGLSTRRLPDKYHLLENGKFKRINFWKKIGEVIDRINPNGRDFSFGTFLAREDMAESAARLARGFAEGFNAARADRLSASRPSGEITSH